MLNLIKSKLAEAEQARQRFRAALTDARLDAFADAAAEQGGMVFNYEKARAIILAALAEASR